MNDLLVSNPPGKDFSDACGIKCGGSGTQKRGAKGNCSVNDAASEEFQPNARAASSTAPPATAAERNNAAAECISSRKLCGGKAKCP